MYLSFTIALKEMWDVWIDSIVFHSQQSTYTLNVSGRPVKYNYSVETATFYNCYDCVLDVIKGEYNIEFTLVKELQVNILALTKSIFYLHTV